MTDKEPVSKKGFTPDWFMRGALGRIGETVDKLTGRNWQPSSSIATSQLVERLKALLEAEKKEVSGKGTVVPHNIKLRMQWDKFSSDESENLKKLENELLIAAADHINDNLYYTYAPLHLEVKPDYFTEGVKLLVSFERFADEENAEVEMNVTMPAINVPAQLTQAKASGPHWQLITRYNIKGKDIEKTLDLASGGRFTVGRTNSNGLILDDASVSKVHASVSIDSTGGMTVADTGSTNGTFINDQRIAYGKAVAFDQEDRLKFGTVEVGVELIRGSTVAEDDQTDESGAMKIGEFEFTSRVPDAEPPDAIQADSLSKLDTEKIDEPKGERPTETPETDPAETKESDKPSQ